MLEQQETNISLFTVPDATFSYTKWIRIHLRSCSLWIQVAGPLLWIHNDGPHTCFLTVMESAEKNLPVLWGSCMA